MNQDNARSAARALILNVNDAEASRYMVTLMLRKAGFEVLEASSGESALAVIEEKHPDLVVLDVRLPGMDGFEVCRRVRETPHTRPIKILHTSATYVALANKIQSLETGADGYLMQPFEPEELIATVNSLLRLNDVEQQLIGKAADLRDADRRKDEFLAMLGHELRNPLAAIAACLPVIERRAPLDEAEKRARAVLARQVAQVERLVDDLLDVARVTQGKIELQDREVDLNALLRTVTEIAKSTKIAPRRQTLNLSLPKDPVCVRGDSARLEQVVANLLDNASKYTPRGGVVDVTLDVVERREAPSARIVVRDNGMGMAKETIPTIFGLFTQADVPLSRSKGGLGVGLTLVQTLVALHGGKVSARSDGLGAGSEFEILLPVLEESVASRADGRPHAHSDVFPAATRRRVLLIEDSIDLRELMKDLLEIWGHEVLCAADGTSGVELAVAQEPDVALVDIGLPGIDGYEVARRLRQDPVARGMKLIAITGYASADQKHLALESGFDHHLAKPVDSTHLAELLSAVPSRQAARDADCR